MRSGLSVLARWLPLCLVASACAQSGGPGEERSNPPLESRREDVPTSPLSRPAPIEEEAGQMPEADPEDVRALVQGNNEFAIELYSRLSQREGNIVCSPYSISSALAMTYAGARGTTAEQMAKALHFSPDQKRLHGAFARMTWELQKGGKPMPYRLRLANTLWGQYGLPFREEFRDIMQRAYRAGFREVDFAGSPDKSRRTINRWVEERTEGKIRDLLKPPDIISQTRLVLTNAIYFIGSWQQPFPKTLTKIGNFEIEPGTLVDVNMMRSSDYARHRYYANQEFQLLELPYKGERLAMIVLLPVKKGGLREVEDRLTAEKLRKGISGLSQRRGPVALPRFRIGTKINLRETLMEMGMDTAFSEQANFTGITPSEELRIKDVVHGCHIDVDELGTEATAATAVIMMKDTPPFVFRADHPFLYLILDRSSAAIVFLGRVLDPR